VAQASCLRVWAASLPPVSSFQTGSKNFAR
jgi:hypothetical protein